MPTKNIGSFGDGGALFIDCFFIDNKVKYIKQHGRKLTSIQDSKFIGLNSRLDEIQASVIFEKLKDIENTTDYYNIKNEVTYKKYSNLNKYLRPELRMNYGNSISEIDESKNLYNKINNTFVFKYEHRDALIELLHKAGIEARAPYNLIIPEQKAYDYDIHRLNKNDKFENATRFCNQLI